MELKVKDVQVVSWDHEGAWVEDHQSIIRCYMVLVKVEGGYRGDDGDWDWGYEGLVHDVYFPDGDLDGNVDLDAPDKAEALAIRIRNAGVINSEHFHIHDFFSLSLEQRLNEEAHHEDLHRRGHGHLSNGVFSSGHE